MKMKLAKTDEPVLAHLKLSEVREYENVIQSQRPVT